MYDEEDLDRLIWVACLAATGMSVAEMRQYVSNGQLGPSGAADQVRLLQEQDRRLTAEAQRIALRQRYVRLKVEYWRAVQAGDDARTQELSEQARAVADELARTKKNEQHHPRSPAPFAAGPLKVPGANYSEETMASLLALTDVMSTGYHAAVSAGVTAGSTVAVVGDGAVGLSGVLSAQLLGAKRIILLGSTHQDRHALAREWGATDIITVRGEEAVKALQDLTDGYGADAVLERVGTREATQTAFAVARAGAVVGRVGVPHDAPVDAGGTFYRNVGMRGGPAPARHYQPDLLEAVIAGSINPGKVFDLSVDLEDIADAYAAMDERRAIKALVRVGDR